MRRTVAPDRLCPVLSWVAKEPPGRRVRWAAAWIAVAAALTSAHPSFATEDPPPRAMVEARAAFAKHRFSAAEKGYRKAIEHGGLSPKDLLEGYVRLGASRAAMRRKDAALAAFRAAAILDSDFAVPPEAGSLGATLAERAKHDTSHLGAIAVSLEVPKSAAADAPLKVEGALSEPHVKIVKQMALIATEQTAGRSHRSTEPPGGTVHFEVPAELAVKDGRVTLRLDALDARGNRLASIEEQVRIEGAAVEPAPMATTTPRQKAPKAATAPLPKEPPPQKGRSLWSSPWTYVVGGAVLVGASAAVYLGTRPPDQVSIGAIDVRPR